MGEEIVNQGFPGDALLGGKVTEGFERGDELDELGIVVVSADVLEDHIDGVSVWNAVM